MGELKSNGEWYVVVHLPGLPGLRPINPRLTVQSRIHVPDQLIGALFVNPVLDVVSLVQP